MYAATDAQLPSPPPRPRKPTSHTDQAVDFYDEMRSKLSDKDAETATRLQDLRRPAGSNPFDMYGFLSEFFAYPFDMSNLFSVL